MNVEVTKEFVLAVEGGVEALRNRARSAEDLPETSRVDNIGTILRTNIERQYQTADLLDGWALRMRNMHGWPREE